MTDKANLPNPNNQPSPVPLGTPVMPLRSFAPKFKHTFKTPLERFRALHVRNRTIKEQLAKGVTMAELARQTGVSRQRILQLVYALDLKVKNKTRDRTAEYAKKRADAEAKAKSKAKAKPKAKGKK